MSRHDYAGAKVAAVKLSELLPQNADSHLSLGNILYYMKDNEGSIKELEKAVALRPDFQVAQVNLGKILISLGRTAEGKAHLKRALDLNPGDEEVKKILSSLPESN